MDYCHWEIEQTTSLEFIKYIKNKKSISDYRKHLYQIRKYLTYLGIDWAKNIKPPAEPMYYPKYISNDDIDTTLKQFENNEYFLRFKALISLGMDSGMRAEELYQLMTEDIDLENRCVHINHNPNNGQSTKTKHSRISYFTSNTRDILIEYLDYFSKNNNLTKLFPKRWIEVKFRVAPIRVKHLRKYFSQEWDRRGGPTSIKKILMGHSLKGDVDLMHYNAQSEDDLKKIYDKVMGEDGTIET